MNLFRARNCTWRGVALLPIAPQFFRLSQSCGAIEPRERSIVLRKRKDAIASEERRPSASRECFVFYISFISFFLLLDFQSLSRSSGLNSEIENRL